MKNRLVICLFAVSTLVLTAASALAAPPRAPLPALDVQPLPGTGFAARFQAGRAEAEITRTHPLELPSPIQYRAADFAAVAGNPWTITHQDITVDVDATVPSLKTDIVLTLRAHKAGIADLGFVSDQPDTVTATTDDGTGLTTDFAAFQGTSGILTVHLAKPLPLEVDFNVHVSRKAKLTCGAVGIGLMACSFDSTFASVVLYDYVLRPSDFMHSPFPSDLHIVTTADKMGAAPGLPSGPSNLPDGRLVWHFKQVELTENAGFSIAAYKPFVTPAANGMPNIRIFSVGNAAANAPDMTKLVQDVIAFYAKNFVPFAWKELNLVQLASNFSGGYSPLSTIFLLSDAFGLAPTDGPWEEMAQLISHEIAHQWWGNLVGMLGNGDIALSESLAEYSSCFYTEQAFQNRSQIITNNLSYVYTVTPAQDMAMTSASVYGSPKYFDIIYHKGSAVMDTLRRELGDDVMDAGMKEYVAEFNHDFAHVANLRAAMEKASGRDLSVFFDQWLNRPGRVNAELASRIVADGSAWKVRVRMRQLDDPPRTFKLLITVDFPDNTSQDFTQQVTPDATGETIIELSVPQHPVRVRVDPQRMLVRAFSVGTPGDANMTGLCDGADLVELALRNGHKIMVTHQGQTYFSGDYNWNELYDINSDYAVNPADETALEGWIGTEAEAF